MDNYIEYNGGYGRIGRIWKCVRLCTVCEQRVECIVMDSSEDEYAHGRICLPCATSLPATVEDYPQEDV